MTESEIRNFLNQGINLAKRIESKKILLLHMKQSATRITRSMTAERVDGTVCSDLMENAVLEYVSLEDEIYNDLAKLTFLRIELMRFINSVEDEKTRTLFQFRYITDMRWENIASSMGYTYQWVFELHRRGIKQLALQAV